MPRTHANETVETSSIKLKWQTRKHFNDTLWSVQTSLTRSEPS